MESFLDNKKKGCCMNKKYTQQPFFSIYINAIKVYF